MSMKVNTQPDVIIPCFNAERTIEAAIRSAVVQSSQPRKIVVHDNCSTDQTTQIIRKLGRQFTNIELIEHKIHVDSMQSFKRSLKNQKIPFMFLGADDVLVPNAIETLISNNWIDKSCDSVIPKHSFLFNNLVLNGANFSITQEYPKPGLMFLINPADNGIIYGLHSPESILGLFPEKYFYGWDVYVNYRILSELKVVFCTSEILCIRSFTSRAKYSKQSEKERGVLPFKMLGSALWETCNFTDKPRLFERLVFLNLHEMAGIYNWTKLRKLLKIRFWNLNYRRRLLKANAKVSANGTMLPLEKLEPGH